MNDCISRQAAIDAVHKNYDTILDFKSDGHTVADSFEDIINALPPAQSEQTDCEYCHEDSDGYGLPFKCGYRECDILFCPMCGRRLADG